ncbi:MAG: ATP-binding protein [Actinobacteria bacterium]|nr:ATP-binding protein [Actinomycetota bacterium]
MTLVIGPRACGKTTLVQRLIDDGVYRRYISFADPGVRATASASPLLFVESLPFGTVIDEVQLVPGVLVPIKEMVDAAGRPGQFLLTGSTRVDLPTMGGTHPLAGRFTRFELAPLNAAERHGRPTTSVATLLEGDPSTLAVTDLVGAVYDREAATTGFPLLVTSGADHRRWRRDYLRSVVPETLTESDHIVDHQRLTRLLEGIAGMAGHELVLNHLVSDLSIDRRTASRYLDLLEEMRLIRRLPGLRMKATDTERAVPKLHLADPILVAPDPGGVSDDRRDALLESFVVNELATQLEWVDGADGLFHWRDRRRDEVDLVVERDSGFVAIEVKRAREVPSGATAGIDAFRARYQDRFRRGLVMYAGRHVLPLGDAVWAVPISALWSR